MRYALTLPNGGPWADPRSLADLAHIAEESGWDGVFLEDYIVWQSRQDMPTYDPWIALAAMALQTQRIRLGLTVTALPRRRPWKVAREAVTLDHLSNGRLILGVGIGDTGESIQPDLSFTHFPEVLDPRQRAVMLDEALEIITGLWSGQPFHYDGSRYHIEEVTFLPRPLQQPRIPIWVGGAWPLKGPTRRAARWDGACMYNRVHGSMGPREVRALRASVESQRGSIQGYDISVSADPPGTSREQQLRHIRSLEEAGATWWSKYLGPATGDFQKVRQIVSRGPMPPF